MAVAVFGVSAVLALQFIGPLPGEPEEEAPKSAVDCLASPLLPTDPEVLFFLVKPAWVAPRYALIRNRDPSAGGDRQCEGVRLDLYNAKSRTLTSKHFVPANTTFLQRWQQRFVHTEEYGYLSLVRSPVREHRADAWFLNLESGEELRASQLAARFTGIAGRMFENPINHIQPRSDGLFVELNDGSWVRLELDNNRVVPVPKRPDAGGAPSSCGRIEYPYDRFASPSSRGDELFDTMRVTQLRPNRIYAERNGSDARYTLRFQGSVSGRSLTTVDGFLEPRVLVPTDCELDGVDRPKTVPLLVWHQTSLDPSAAEGRLTRVNLDGESEWTVAVPILNFDPPVRIFGATLFVWAKERATISPDGNQVDRGVALWIDYEKGRVLNRLLIGPGSQ
ncbi:MAG: hypothetical protein AAFQ65_09395 [Myxococcota bacterium]